MSDSANDKVLERIRALLAMGGDVSSEHEAAIALKRARSLMDKHQVSLADIENIKDNTFGYSEYESHSTQQRLWVTGIGIAVARLNDCILRVKPRESKREKFVYLFKGFSEDTKVCDFMLAYLVDTCNRIYNRDKGKLGLSGSGDKNAFLLGLCQGLTDRINAMIEDRKSSTVSQGRSLVLVKSAMVESEFGPERYRTVKSRNVDDNIHRAGRKAADGIHLGSFVGNSSKAHANIA